MLPGDKMAQTDRAAVLLAPKQLCSILFFLCVIAYIINPELFGGYYIQLEITFGYQSGGNSPTLHPRIRLSGMDPLFVAPRAIELTPVAAP